MLLTGNVVLINGRYGKATQARIIAQTEREFLATLDPETRGETTLTVNEKPNETRADRIARMIERMRK